MEIIVNISIFAKKEGTHRNGVKAPENSNNFWEEVRRSMLSVTCEECLLYSPHHLSQLLENSVFTRVVHTDRRQTIDNNFHQGPLNSFSQPLLYVPKRILSTDKQSSASEAR